MWHGKGDSILKVKAIFSESNAIMPIFMEFKKYKI